MMAPRSVDLQRLNDGRVRLLQPMSVILNGQRLTVPRGFTCDGCRWGSRAMRAVILHDWLAHDAVSVKRTTSPRTRRLFVAQLLAVDGVPRWRRWWIVTVDRWRRHR